MKDEFWKLHERANQAFDRYLNASERYSAALISEPDDVVDSLRAEIESARAEYHTARDAKHAVMARDKAMGRILK